MPQEIATGASAPLAKVAAPAPRPQVQGPPPDAHLRPRVSGPFLYVGEHKLQVKAVTYGTFAANEDGDLFPGRSQVRKDLAAMRSANANAVRVYTCPPAWFLEEARRAGLRVIVGIYWDASACRFDDPKTLKDARDAVRQAVRTCRPFADVVLAYVIGNEIPPLIVRFHGWRTIGRFLRKLYDAAKAEDPEGLVTYGNYPSTEFLQLDFLDFQMLNVYLLEREKLASYLDRMMIECKGKPLMLGEVGEDSLHKSEEHQAEILDWTIPLAFDKGVCGVCVFAWTDEWVVGGCAVEDWDFGLVDRERNPKQALATVQRRFGESPLRRRTGRWPKVSVIVCNYNGGETLDETLGSLVELDYPDYEIIYVDDGSTDNSLVVARGYSGAVRIIAQEENQGLSVARNVGLQHATGEIVAYIDSDAYADPDWLRHLVLTITSGDCAGAGGPNLTPASDGLTAQLIATCPGNPTYVLKDNIHADHIAGVNMAFRKEALERIDGFDPVHWKAGDDVDICWRLEDAGMRLGFSPAAIVWHHRRPSVRLYLKQQYGYGEAENQLERKHPERFNLAGYIRWGGRVYLAPKKATELFRPFIYHGPLGTGLFQTLYQKDPSYMMDVPAMIQWYIGALLLIAVTPISPWFTVIGAAMLMVSLWVAMVTAFTTQLPFNLSRGQQLRKVWIVGMMHFLHPVVRTAGRVMARLEADRGGRRLRLRWLKPTRLLQELRHGRRPQKQVVHYWGSLERRELIQQLHAEIKKHGLRASFGHEWNNHDLAVGTSRLADGRIFTAQEYFGQAVSVGFKAYLTSVARLALFVTMLGPLVWSLYSPWFLTLLVVPALLGAWCLAQCARLRAHVWEAVEVCMECRQARRFEERA